MTTNGDNGDSGGQSVPRERVSLFGAVLLWTMRCGKSCEALAQSLALSVLCSDIGTGG